METFKCKQCGNEDMSEATVVEHGAETLYAVVGGGTGGEPLRLSMHEVIYDNMTLSWFCTKCETETAFEPGTEVEYA